MKVRAIISLLLLNCGIVCIYAQSYSQVFVSETTYLNKNCSDSTLTVHYFDDFGHPCQDVTNVGNPLGHFLVTEMTLDAKGRTTKEFLPIVSENASYMAPSVVAANTQSVYSDAFPYIKTQYDADDEVLKVTPYGAMWHNNTRCQQYETITNSADVKRYSAPIGTSALYESGYYSPGTLIGKRVTDEDGKTITTFLDLQGKIILERRDTNNDTYYVYNDREELRFVLSPQYQQIQDIRKFAFEYRYDSKGRVERKYIPGSDYVLYYYDVMDRVVFEQDARLRERNLYRYYIYDNFSRVTEQGVCSDMYYSDKEFEKKNFYDNYSFVTEIDSIPQNLHVSQGTKVRSLLAGTIQKASNEDLYYTFYNYDENGNITDKKSFSPNGHNVWLQTSYSFTNKPLTSNVTIYREGNIYGYNLNNNYDSGTDLLLSQTLTPSYNNTTYPTQTICTYQYDDYGRISRQTNGIGVASIDYQYNLQGWLTRISSSHFCENLYYADTGNIPCYNGNVSRATYSSGAITHGYDFTYDGLNRLTASNYGETMSLQEYQRRYSQLIDYDANGNITLSVTYGKYSPSEYGVIDVLTYDYNGNQLASVNKIGNVITNNPSVTMTFNDGTDDDEEYFYDSCGSLIADANKGIAHIEYDNLGYPKEIQFTNGNKILYVYLPDGMKIKTTYITAIDGIVVPLLNSVDLSSEQILSRDSTEYWDNIIRYSGQDERTRFLFGNGYMDSVNHLEISTEGPGALFSYSDPLAQNSLPHEGGYIFPDLPIAPPTVSYHYYTKDHLGNVRVVVNGNGTVEQNTHYYPSGTIIPDLSTNQSLQPYKYNGKELDRMHGLDWYDYGARNYDPVLGCWDRIDPLCEKYYNISPYAYCSRNPVLHIDSDGRRDYTIDKNGYFKETTSFFDKLKELFGIKTPDRVYLQGNRTPFATYAAGTISDIEYGQKGEDSYVKFDIKDKKIAHEIYMKIAHETDVEWGLISHGKHGEMTYTLINQHQNKTLGVPATIYLNKYKDVKEFRHSHPQDPTVKKYGSNLPPVPSSPTLEDVTTAKTFPNIKCFIDEMNYGYTYTINPKNEKYYKNR